MKIFKIAAIGGVTAAALIGFAGPAAASTPIAHTPCTRSEMMKPDWDVNTGEPVICVSTGGTGLKWVPDATR
ncbi:hypothetical protein LTV02_36845 [Nocardia yamanashiensis]|uniref:hypothetical protein n=1 Tax=Nocardia yamanashiensis TaxID=209247 RepID=UPI001E31BD6F|nr:hypothetical protein [Nocardia yamanashiensis]UGT41437.1 hypothetical protein LTV02_36845 [Nocardia yamanashiensis]